MGALALRRTKTTPGLGGRPLVEMPRKTTMLLHVRAQHMPQCGKRASGTRSSLE
jgi:hypothetical protein